MRFQYCPECGTKAQNRPIGDEGMIPFCVQCQRPLFDYFSTCVLSVVRNPKGELALIRQSYGESNRLAHYVGVAGYMKCGETAEEAAIREISEEIGLTPASVRYIMSVWHEKRDQLMLCFCADLAEDAEFCCSGEVAEAKWFSPEEAQQAVRQGSIIHRLVAAVIAEGGV